MGGHSGDDIRGQSPWWWWLHRAAVDHLGWQARFSRTSTHRVLFLSAPDFIAKVQLYPWYYYREHFRRRQGIEFREIPVGEFQKAPDRFRDPRVTAVCFQSWFDLSEDQMSQLVGKIRSAFPSARLGYLDWFAPSDLRYASVTVHQGIEVYLKKSLFRDRRRYEQPTLGDTNLTDYYSRKFGIPYPMTKFEVPPSLFSKFVLGPTFYFSPRAVRAFLGSVPSHADRPIDLHCRIGTKGTAWYQAMREHARDQVRALRGLRAVGGQQAPPRQYLQELRHSKMCFSPFGYGEVCLRDFEAVVAGSLLIKPDMSHVEIDPDFFLPHETYVPVAWDGSDLQEKCDYYLKDEGARRKITTRAFEVIQDYLRQHRFLDRMDTFFGLLLGDGAPSARSARDLPAGSGGTGTPTPARTGGSGGGPPRRVACVHQGDYGAARRRLASGGPETYGGQRYTVEAFERFVEGIPHLVVSLEAPSGCDRDGSGEFVGVPGIKLPGLPRSWEARVRAGQVLKELERFGPTHLLLRSDDVVGCRILSWANRHRIPTAALLASRFNPTHPPCLKFCQLANEPNVAWVANHNRVATASLAECGLRPEKAIPWDYPPVVRPDENPPKTSPGAGPLRVVYAGSVIVDKGVLEAIQAVEQVRSSVPSLRLSICGEGALRPTLLGHPGIQAGWLEVTGSVPSDEILARMKAGWLVVVPTRHSYPEALPLVITESLVTRTPVLLSDHPVFKAYFRDGAGVRLFRAEDPSSLAAILGELAGAPAAYAALSEQTAEVWKALQIETKFHHLLERLSREWELPAAQAQAAGLGGGKPSAL